MVSSPLSCWPVRARLVTRPGLLLLLGEGNDEDADGEAVNNDLQPMNLGQKDEHNTATNKDLQKPHAEGQDEDGGNTQSQHAENQPADDAQTGFVPVAATKEQTSLVKQLGLVKMIWPRSKFGPAEPLDEEKGPVPTKNGQPVADTKTGYSNDEKMGLSLDARGDLRLLMHEGALLLNPYLGDILQMNLSEFQFSPRDDNSFYPFFFDHAQPRVDPKVKKKTSLLLCITINMPFHPGEQNVPHAIAAELTTGDKGDEHLHATHDSHNDDYVNADPVYHLPPLRGSSSHAAMVKEVAVAALVTSCMIFPFSRLRGRIWCNQARETISNADADYGAALQSKKIALFTIKAPFDPG